MSSCAVENSFDCKKSIKVKNEKQEHQMYVIFLFLIVGSVFGLTPSRSKESKAEVMDKTACAVKCTIQMQDGRKTATCVYDRGGVIQFEVDKFNGIVYTNTIKSSANSIGLEFRPASATFHVAGEYPMEMRCDCGIFGRINILAEWLLEQKRTK